MKVLFNRFYLNDGYSNEQYSIFDLGIVSRSFLLCACECNNLEIVKFFLETSKNKIYTIQLGAAIDICIEHNHIKILKYIYENYKNKLKNTTITKINKININLNFI